MHENRPAEEMHNRFGLRRKGSIHIFHQPLLQLVGKGQINLLAQHGPYQRFIQIRLTNNPVSCVSFDVSFNNSSVWPADRRTSDLYRVKPKSHVLPDHIRCSRSTSGVKCFNAKSVLFSVSPKSISCSPYRISFMIDPLPPVQVRFG